MKQQQRQNFEQQIENVDDKDAETDQTDRIEASVFRFVPDELQQRVAIGIAQEHEILIEYRIDQIHDPDQDQDLGDGCQNTRIIKRDLVGDKAGNDVGDDRSVIKELVDRIEVPERKR